MAQSGWRLSDDLLRRVRVRCAESGERQNVFVERALESALGDSSMAEQPRRREPNSRVAGSTPAPSAPSRASAEPVPSEAKKPPSAEQASPGLRSPSGGARLAAPVPGVKSARDLMEAKQRQMNEARAKKK